MIRPLSAKASGALLGRPPLPIVRIKQAKPAHQTKSEPAAGKVFEAYSFIVVLSDLAGPGERGRSGRAPNTPRPFLFLLEKKEAKDHLRGLLPP